MLRHIKRTHYESVWALHGRINDYSQQQLQTVTLQYLLELGKRRDIKSCAEFVYKELPVRLARRIIHLQHLPFSIHSVTHS
jgi:hypothetical protein